MTGCEDSLPEQKYRSPFLTRWAGEAMLYNWSELRKFRLWRALWIALAEAEKELGLGISDHQISQLKEHREEINLEVARKREAEVRHDVVAHLYAFGVQCPDARPILHLGATSAFVGDNADLIMMRDALKLLIGPLASTCRSLASFARKRKDMPCLARTHFQPAQLTTVGKRACMWLQDFLHDLEQIASLAENIPFRGVKGATGTQASFLAIFEGDPEKVKKLEELVAQKMGFSQILPIAGQT